MPPLQTSNEKTLLHRSPDQSTPNKYDHPFYNSTQSLNEQFRSRMEQDSLDLQARFRDHLQYRTGIYENVLSAQRNFHPGIHEIPTFSHATGQAIKDEPVMIAETYRDSHEHANERLSMEDNMDTVDSDDHFAETKTRHVSDRATVLRTCIPCGIEFGTKMLLHEHKLSVHRDIMFQCTYPGCDKVYSRGRQLRQHLDAHSGKQFQCVACLKTFPLRRGYYQHVTQFCSVLRNKNARACDVPEPRVILTGDANNFETGLVN